MASIFEMLMVIAFGFAWPTSIYKSIKAKTAKGKSLTFLVVILFGYACGITSKLLADTISYVLVFYCINAVMVIIDIILFFRNVILDKKCENESARAQQAVDAAVVKDAAGE